MFMASWTDIVCWYGVDESLDRWEIEQWLDYGKTRKTGLLDNDVAKYVLDDLAGELLYVEDSPNLMHVRYIDYMSYFAGRKDRQSERMKARAFHESMDRPDNVPLSEFYGIPFSLVGIGLESVDIPFLSRVWRM